MNGTVECFESMIKKQIHYLNVNECKKDFVGVGSTFSFYLIENTEIYTTTHVICEFEKQIFDNNIQLNENMQILPLLLTQEVIDLLCKLFNYSNTNKFIRKDPYKTKNDIRTKQDNEFKHPVITFKKKDGNLDINYIKNKILNQDEKKVLLFRNGYLNPTYDDGLNGVGNNIHVCIVNNKEEGINLVNLYESNIYKFIFKICTYSRFNNGRIMNWLYSPLSLDEIKKKLTEDEISIINKFT